MGTIAQPPAIRISSTSQDSAKANRWHHTSLQVADTLTAAEAASTALIQPSPTPNLGIGAYPIISSEPLPVSRGASIDPPSL